MDRNAQIFIKSIDSTNPNQRIIAIKVSALKTQGLIERGAKLQQELNQLWKSLNSEEVSTDQVQHELIISSYNIYRRDINLSLKKIFNSSRRKYLKIVIPSMRLIGGPCSIVITILILKKMAIQSYEQLTNTPIRN